MRRLQRSCHLFEATVNGNGCRYLTGRALREALREQLTIELVEELASLPMVQVLLKDTKWQAFVRGVVLMKRLEATRGSVQQQQPRNRAGHVHFLSHLSNLDCLMLQVRTNPEICRAARAAASYHHRGRKRKAIDQ